MIFFDIFNWGKDSKQDTTAQLAFVEKYQSFQELLLDNNHALELMTGLEQDCYGVKPFTLSEVLSQVEQLVGTVYDIAEDLNKLSTGRYPGLFDATERIGVAVLQELVRRKKKEKSNLTIPLQRLSLDHVQEVGGKAANLGEVSNRVHLPVPRGFSVSAYACHHFLHTNNLNAKIQEILKRLNVNDTADLIERSTQVRKLIQGSPLPEDLAQCLQAEVESLVLEFGPDIRLAVRSSATSEDSEASFAGQHSTVLNVRRDGVIEAYKEVVASTFNPRAIYYRRSKGYPDEDVIMAVLCVIMVDAKASGILYTRDPNDSRRNVLLVNAVWGLGVGAVDGSASTDYFELNKKDLSVIDTKIADKPTRVTLREDQGLFTENVSENLRRTSCLQPEQINLLAQYGLTLEEHYNIPLDIEWALGRDGRMIILQARPLNLDLVVPQTEAQSREAARIKAEFPGHRVLIEGGATASRGKACGLAYVLTSDHNLLNIPEGSILIASQTSPRYVPVLGRVQAIVTDVGSVTGHMASVAREFEVPTLVGTENATKVIPHGEEITVDATNGLVFQGRVDQILERKRPNNPMKGSPTYKAAHSALKRIAILNLTDPNHDNFTPEGCQTLHDVIRFAHEMSMREMFRFGDAVGEDIGFAVRVRVALPMQILAVDVGGGLACEPGTRVVEASAVTSVPFKALLKGMTRPDVRWVGGVGVDWKGFMTIVAESAMQDPSMGDRMGGPNYVLISKEYLNFNSRLGYHFAVLDTYCGPRVNDNYITFSFKGGAADIGRRSRRALLIVQILKRLGFKAEIKGDMVRGSIKKYTAEVIEEKLDMIGRLLGSVRLLDMVLSDDGQINWYVEEFMNGNYTFQRELEKV